MARSVIKNPHDERLDFSGAVNNLQISRSPDGRIVLSFPTDETSDYVTQLVIAPTYIRVDSNITGSKWVSLS